MIVQRLPSNGINLEWWGWGAYQEEKQKNWTLKKKVYLMKSMHRYRLIQDLRIHNLIPHPWKPYLEHRPASLIWWKSIKGVKGIDMGLAKRVNWNKCNNTAVNACHSFLDSNESNSRYIIDSPWSPKLVDIINIIL